MAIKSSKYAEMSNLEVLADIVPRIMKGQRPFPHVKKADKAKGTPRYEGIRWNKP